MSDSFQFYEATRNETLAVGLSSTNVADERPLNNANARKVINIRNTSTSDTAKITIILSQTQSPQENKGIVLNKNEGFSDATSEGYDCWQGKIKAICNEADGQLSIFER